MCSKRDNIPLKIDYGNNKENLKEINPMSQYLSFYN